MRRRSLSSFSAFFSSDGEAFQMTKWRSLIRTIRQQFKVKLIISLSVIITVCSVVTGYISYRINLRLFEEEVSNQYLKTSEQTMVQIGYKIQDIYRITDFIFFHPYVEQLVLGMQEEAGEQESAAYRNYQLERELAEVLLPLKSETPYIRGVYITDVRGNNLFYSHSNMLVPPQFPEFYNQVEEGMPSPSAEIVWQRLKLQDELEPSGEKSYLVAARKLMSTKQYRLYGTVILIMDETLFEESLYPLMTARAMGVHLYDQYSRLLYSLEPPQPAGFMPELEEGVGTFVQSNSTADYLAVTSVYEPRAFKLLSSVSLSGIKEKGRNVYKLALVSGFISILLMTASISFLSGKMLKPLLVLVKAMHRVREGNFRVAIPKASADEFGFLTDSFNRMMTHIDTLIQEAYVSKLSEKEAELKALQAQLNPHFLHNTLNTIYWKIMLLYDDEETASLVTSLSNLLKYSLEPVSTPSTLQEELAQIRNYINIQEARYGSNLHVNITMEEGLEQGRMQRLLLQPLVENVFIHAFRDMSGEKRLSIRAYRQGEDTLRIDIEDNGCGMPAEILRGLQRKRLAPAGRRPEERESIGIQNVIRRIDLVYGDMYGLEIHPLHEGTQMSLKLPFIVEPDRKEEA
ncbi:sensor histidine kinase [Paenibacillus sp. YN15]|nr:sensor histidine kinase [Paenibacillus sp. YN15]